MEKIAEIANQTVDDLIDELVAGAYMKEPWSAMTESDRARLVSIARNGCIKWERHLWSRGKLES